MDRRYKKIAGKKMAPDGNEPIRMEAARGGLCPVDAKGLLKEEEDGQKSRNSLLFLQTWNITNNSYMLRIEPGFIP